MIKFLAFFAATNTLDANPVAAMDAVWASEGASKKYAYSCARGNDRVKKAMQTSKHRKYVLAMVFTFVLVNNPGFGKAAPENRPYDAGLLRLSEILGSVHYLRALCGINDGTVWREKMEQLITTEGVTVKRKLKLTKSFNKGYKSFQRTYRRCTPTAKTAINLFLEEGMEISERLINKHH